VGVAASGSYPPTRLLASNRRRGRRIRSGRLRPIIESMNEAHRVRARLRRASHGQRTPNQDKKPAKDDGKPDISRDRTHHRARQEPARARRGLEPIFSAESNRPLTMSNQFHAISTRRVRQTDSPKRSGVASRTLSRRCASKITEPLNVRLSARYGISAVREECARSVGASKWPRRNLNLALAAGPRVRHIRVHGAVAEWLKAAVC
jgi:hypothetical protein